MCCWSRAEHWFLFLLKSHIVNNMQAAHDMFAAASSSVSSRAHSLRQVSWGLEARSPTGNMFYSEGRWIGSRHDQTITDSYFVYNTVSGFILYKFLWIWGVVFSGWCFSHWHSCRSEWCGMWTYYVDIPRLQKHPKRSETDIVIMYKSQLRIGLD